MPTRKRYGLSKSKISAFEQCPKRLWLQMHRGDEATGDEGTEQRFATGNLVGRLAQELYEGGIEVQVDPDLAAAVETTRRLIEEGFAGPIFEATFSHEGVLVRADVLERTADGTWAMAEVKSAKTVKPRYRSDLATQVWVMRGAGVPPASAAIRHLDGDFVLKREGDLAGVLTDTELMSELEPVIAQRGALIETIHAVLNDGQPDIEMGPQCAEPFRCEFQDHCSRDLPAGPEWPLTVMPANTRKRLAAFGTDDLMDLDVDELDERDAWLVAATQTGKPYHDVGGATSEIDEWSWPRAWLDFETVSPAVPLWVGTGSYDRVPFQYSLHLEQWDGTIHHTSFLSTDGTDPRRSLAEALLANIPPGATPIAYYASFERGVLKELADAFPDLANRLLEMRADTVDLLPVAKRNWYHRDQHGSWSIKAVLPTMSTTGYDGMEIKDGGAAPDAYLEAIHPDTTPARHQAIRDALEAYCKLDTWAMILVARHLIGKVEA